jgi:uncharacterized protein YdiU (UPF0061 family)
LSKVFPSVEPLQAGMDRYADVYAAASRMMTAQKLGLSTLQDHDSEWVTGLFALMNDAQLDMTLFFRLLADVDLGAIGSASVDTLRPSFYLDPLPTEHEAALIEWLKLYAARVAQDPLDAAERKRIMNAANPRYVLRNYLAQEAIDLATSGDASRIQELLEVLRHPYDEQPDNVRFAAKRPEWARHKVGCSMLSCSS